MLLPAEVVLRTQAADGVDNDALWGKPGEPGLPCESIKLQSSASALLE